MRIAVQIHAPGFEVQPFAGTCTTVWPAVFEDVSGASTNGAAIEIRGSVASRSLRISEERIGVAALGLFDLVFRWPSPATQVSMTGPGGRRTSRGVHIDHLAAYEIGEILGGGRQLPNMRLAVSAAGLQRVDDLCAAAMRLPVPRLDSLLGALAQVSIAAAASRPSDRLGPLWSAISLVYPNMSELKRIDTLLASPGFASEEARRSDAWSRLARFRREFYRDTWFYGGLRKRLQAPARTTADRIQVATVLAYAARSAVAHGHWARVAEATRPAALAAEQWLWALLERELEYRITGSRLPVVAAIGRTAVTR